MLSDPGRTTIKAWIRAPGSEPLPGTYNFGKLVPKLLPVRNIPNKKFH
jgi:hypothetical protein